MATVLFYRNESPDQVVQKDLTQIYPPEGETINYELFNAQDVMSPTLRTTKFSGHGTCNYVWISELSRYYYVRSKTRANGVLIWNLEEDVRMSVLAQHPERWECITARQEDAYNTYLQDGEMPALSYTKVATLKFPHGLTTDTCILMTVG